MATSKKRRKKKTSSESKTVQLHVSSQNARKPVKALSAADVIQAHKHVSDRHLKLIYFIPHRAHELTEATYFSLFSAGIADTWAMLMEASRYVSDVREPFSKREVILDFRMRRLLYRSITPVTIDALEIAATKGVIEELFRVVLTNDADMADQVDKIRFSDDVPFLHVSSVGGAGRMLPEAFNQEAVIDFSKAVLDHVENFLEDGPSFAAYVRAQMEDDDRQKRLCSKLKDAGHNLTKPNEYALSSFGWDLKAIAPLVVNESSFPKRDQYIKRICESADAVSNARAALQAKRPSRLDNRYVVTVPSVLWGHYQNWRDRGSELTGEDKIAFGLAYKGALKQRTYFTETDVATNDIFKNALFRSIMVVRAKEQRCYTAALTLLASGSLTPVLRLEPSLNEVRGELRMLALCVRQESYIRRQYKQSRLARVVAKKMRLQVASEFLTRIDRAESGGRIEGLKLVADVPLEWIPTRGLPLGLRFDVSRLPVTPGNLLFSHCVQRPIALQKTRFSDILIVRSFRVSDPIRGVLEDAISRTLSTAPARWSTVRFVDVGSEEELLTAINGCKGAMIIFDCHGGFDETLGVGTIVIAGKPVNVWALREICTLPPIVVFSACDTHPLDGSHGSCANAAFVLGAISVLATSMPINSAWAALFIARLLLRVDEFLPIAIESRGSISWREFVAGLLRMSYTTEILNTLERYTKLSMTSDARRGVLLSASVAINSGRADWFDRFLAAVSSNSGATPSSLKKDIEKWASITDIQKYIHLGSPENIILVADKDAAMSEKI